MDIQSIIDGLHPLERKVMQHISKAKNIQDLIKFTNLKEVEVMRALQWLENKKLLKLNINKEKVVKLDANGEVYHKKGLPEERLVKVLTAKPQSVSDLAKKAGIDPSAINICIGLLRSKALIDITKGKELQINLSIGADKRVKESLEQKFIKNFKPINLSNLKPEEKFALEQLLKRKKILKIDETKQVNIKILDLGKKLTIKKIKDDDSIGKLTPGMLKQSSWKDKKFRKYDVEINVPKINRGKAHFVDEAVDYIKQIWLDLGFKEMNGNMVQSAFWDLDSLFVPQDHPAREMQDTFYLDGKAKLPKIVDKVKKVHENGGDTGSKGWEYNFSKIETSKILLRTHTTVLSAKKLTELKKEDLPAKFFSVNKVFRNETLDWKHLFEFYQVEGIVVDPNANLKHLKGYLTQFYKKMGYEKVRMRPGHFPYTEPSIEVDVFHPVKKEWVELGGAGIFRPEVTKTLLGFECPVLAWGQGMGRIISEYWRINDIRELYKNDIKQLREIKTWMR